MRSRKLSCKGLVSRGFLGRKPTSRRRIGILNKKHEVGEWSLGQMAASGCVNFEKLAPGIGGQRQRERASGLPLCLVRCKRGCSAKGPKTLRRQFGQVR